MPSQSMMLNKFQMGDYNRCLRPESDLWKLPLLLYGNRYIKSPEGDEKYSSGVFETTLGEMLTRHYEHDAHFVQFYSPFRIRHTKSGTQHPKIFHFMAFDFDWHNHDESPPVAELENLMRVASIIDKSPHVIYATPHGARWIYLIEPLEDPLIFEEKRLAFLEKFIIQPLQNRKKVHPYWYEVDLTPDWTRLFRTPNHKKDDKPPYTTTEVFYHAELTTPYALKVNRKKQKPKKGKKDMRPSIHGNTKQIGGLQRMLKKEAKPGEWYARARWAFAKVNGDEKAADALRDTLEGIIDGFPDSKPERMKDLERLHKYTVQGRFVNE